MRKILTGLTKIRWSRMGKPQEDIKLNRFQDEVQEEEDSEKLVYLTSRVFNTYESKVDLGFCYTLYIYEAAIKPVAPHMARTSDAEAALLIVS